MQQGITFQKTFGVDETKQSSAVCFQMLKDAALHTLEHVASQGSYQRQSYDITSLLKDTLKGVTRTVTGAEHSAACTRF